MNMSSVSEPTFRERQRKAAEEAFVQAAEVVICRQGYERARMQDVAKEAGCATGTLYLYFKNKEDLFNAILYRHVRAVGEAITEALAGDEDPLERLRRKTEAVLRYFDKHMDFARIFFNANPGSRNDLATGLPSDALELYLEQKDLELQALKAAQKKRQIRRDIDPEDLLELTHGMIGSALARWSASGAPPRDEQVRLVWSFMLGGLGGR
jgi:AcrR family transcriptional regulator